MGLRLKRKKPQINPEQRKELLDVMRSEMENFVSKDFLKKYLADIEKDEKKKRLWNSLSTRKKIQVLRYHYKKGGSVNVKKDK